MSRVKCDICGETFDAEYYYNWHAALGGCSEQKDERQE